MLYTPFPVPRRYIHYVLVFLLLIAQQGALAHATWHARGADEHASHVHSLHGGGHAHDGPDAHHDHDHGHDHGHDHESPSGQASLCAFDFAFGQVLGVVYGSSAPLQMPVPAAVPIADVFHSRRSVDAVPALARGPPVVL